MVFDNVEHYKNNIAPEMQNTFWERFFYRSKQKTNAS
jgi:hypothetical protein